MKLKPNDLERFREIREAMSKRTKIDDTKEFNEIEYFNLLYLDNQDTSKTYKDISEKKWMQNW